MARHEDIDPGKEADRASGEATDAGEKAAGAGEKATESASDGGDGVVKQLTKVAGAAAVASLSPVIKDAVTNLAGTAVKKAPELLANAGGAGAIADKAKDAIAGGGEDGGGLLSKVKDVATGGGGDGGGDAPSGTGRGRRMPVQQSVDIGAPVEVVYNQFTQFEDFPKFMHRVESVEQRDEAHVVFRSKQWNVNRQWEAEIIDQRPDERIAWRSTSGVKLTGVVTFHPIAERLTHVEVNVDFDPDGFFEKVGRGMRFAKRSIRADLHRFKAYVMMQEEETGEWRGYVEDGEPVEESEYFEDDGEESDDEPVAEEDEPVAEDEDEDEPVAEDEDVEDEPDEEEPEPKPRRARRSKQTASRSRQTASRSRQSGSRSRQSASSKSSGSSRSRSSASRNGDEGSSSSGKQRRTRSRSGGRSGRRSS